MSNPVFGSGYFWEPHSQCNPENDFPAVSAHEQHNNEGKSLEKLKTDRSNEEENLEDKGKNSKGSPKKQTANQPNNKTVNKQQGKTKKETPKNSTKADKNLTRYKSAANFGSKTTKTRLAK